MKRPRRPLAILALLTLTSGCELVVQLDPSIVDASVSDACNICADVSADVSYDGDVSIYGPLPGDAGGDATLDADARTHP